ncbi:SIR2-domain-containing protein [Phellopilus nigrolimitatus]|nr:SIR2-domain-containing protein [Phellopilus nigrolimitatus]
MWRGVPSDDEPQMLESLDLPGITKFMKSKSCKNVFMMVRNPDRLLCNTCLYTLKIQAGAGISTSAGIPDFRSPDTGLYANLARLRLPYPEAVFDISFFRRNPKPFYVLANELAPGKFRPTLTHSFIRLLAEKGLLHTCFTQNIDTLERAAGVPPNKIIEAHGSFADQHCIKCGAQYPHEKIKANIEAQDIPVCERPKCGGYVKPDIVFFGESLPDEFSAGVRHLRNADLLIVMGTSLTVHPFASLTELVPNKCPRLLLNLDHVGGWGSRVNDVACLMSCDSAVRELCKLLEWEVELERLWAETNPNPKRGRKGEVHPKGSLARILERKPSKGALDDVMDKLAKMVGEAKLEDTTPRVPEKSEGQEAGTVAVQKDLSGTTESNIDNLRSSTVKDKEPHESTPESEEKETNRPTFTEIGKP